MHHQSNSFFKSPWRDALFLQRPILYLTAVAVAFGLPQNSGTGQVQPCEWTDVPSNGMYSTSGFGAVTESTGSGDTYRGNIGNPYGSNFVQVSATDACKYKYVIQLRGSNTDDWTVIFWNKYGPDGQMDGWYGRGCLRFTLRPGDTQYVAINADSQGGWTAAPGPHRSIRRLCVHMG